MSRGPGLIIAQNALESLLIKLSILSREFISLTKSSVKTQVAYIKYEGYFLILYGEVYKFHRFFNFEVKKHQFRGFAAYMFHTRIYSEFEAEYFVCLCVCLSVCLSVCVSVCPSPPYNFWSAWFTEPQFLSTLENFRPTKLSYSEFWIFISVRGYQHFHFYFYFQYISKTIKAITLKICSCVEKYNLSNYFLLKISSISQTFFIEKNIFILTNLCI